MVPCKYSEFWLTPPTDWVSMQDAPENWIRKEHIPELIGKLGSKQPCAGGHSERDSRAVGIGGYGPGKKSRSTIGHEAAHMIESFRHGLYPKSHAFTIDWTTPDDDALRAWWRDFDRGGRKEREGRGAQGGADQPAAAPESKQEGEKKPKPGAVDAGADEMVREPGPGEKIEKTKLGDEEIKRLLVGGWTHEREIRDIYSVNQAYTFKREGSYVMNRVSRVRSQKKREEINVREEWTVRDGILTLTPTEPKGEEKSLYGRFTAYTIMKIGDSAMEWQIAREHSDASPAVKRTLTITTHKRVK